MTQHSTWLDDCGGVAQKPTRRSPMTQVARAAIGGSLLLGSLLAPVANAGEIRRVEGLEFSTVLVVGSVDVEVAQGDSHELYLRGDVETLDREPFYVKGDTLVLGKNTGSWTAKRRDISFKVELPILDELEVRGSGDVYIKPFAQDSGDTTEISIDGSGDIKLYEFRGGRLELRVKGSGDLAAIAIEVDELDTVVKGSGDLYIKAVQAEEGSFVLSGSGDIGVKQPSFARGVTASSVGSGEIDLEELSCDNADIKVVGSGSIFIGTVGEMLDASILGSGDIRYRGEPEIEKSVIGSGDVRGRD
ncbi:MAG: DUF2807 domain-containing protein [Pseudomonadota bacterium]